MNDPQRIENGGPFRQKLMSAISVFVQELINDERCRSAIENHFADVMNFDDPEYKLKYAHEEIFAALPRETRNTYELIMSYIELENSARGLKDCQYYFRRYPFYKLPINHGDHLANIIEMYYSRFYQIRERLKNFLNLANRISPKPMFDVSRILKAYDKHFRHEIRARNSIHHSAIYRDLETKRMSFGALMLRDEFDDGKLKSSYLQEYRRIARSWAHRSRNQSMTIENLLESIAKHLLQNFPFFAQSASTRHSRISGQ